MPGELIAEVGHEIAAHPSTFAIEVVQFVMLLAIVGAIVFGVGKRRGFVVNMLSERRDRLAGRLETASHAEADLAASRQRAEELVAAARSEAAAVLREARSESRRVEEEARAQADAEADEIRARAQETLAGESEDMQADVRGQLVGVVADATRSIMNESYGPSEQRALIQRAVLAGIEHLEEGSYAPAGQGAQR